MKSVADPGFPRGGCANLLFLPIFPKNCMKLKKFGPRGGGRASLVPHLDPPMEIITINVILVYFVNNTTFTILTLLTYLSILCFNLEGIISCAGDTSVP